MDDTYVLEAEPGDYITIARKAKNKEEWYIGGITDENARTANISFDFLPTDKKFIATIYEDGKDASWDKKPESYTIRKVLINSKSKMKQNLASGGGFAIAVSNGSPKELELLGGL